MDPDDFATDRDIMSGETEGFRKLMTESLEATGKRRGVLQRSGCMCVALPPTLNPRLVNQQGVFLLNCAEELSFEESLTKMMKGCGEWCRKIDIPVHLVPEIEARLFQMNVHEQSLFPDLEGLAGFIRQRIRLNWK
jgi:hypothetical protein